MAVDAARGAGGIGCEAPDIAPPLPPAQLTRYRDGKIAEHWNIVDVAGLMQQLAAG